MKIGIIGCGGIAFGKHMPCMKKDGGFEILALCDVIAERAENAAKEYGVEGARVYTDYTELLQKEKDIETIYVLTPNRMHSAITVAALDAGFNVLCEKPMAINYEEAKKMLEAEKRSGKLLTIGYQHRQDHDVQYVKKEMLKDTFGEIYYAKARVLRRRGVPTHGVFQNEYEQGGGCLVDVGTHALDTVLWLMNNYEPAYVVGSVYHKLGSLPEEMQGNPMGTWTTENFQVEDSAFGYIVMKNGATVLLETSWALNMLEGESVQYQLCGTRAGCDNFTVNGKLRINGVKNGVQFIEEPSFAAGGIAFYDGKSTDPRTEEQRVFREACEGKGELTVRSEQAAVVTMLLSAIYESAKTGKPVFFN